MSLPEVEPTQAALILVVEDKPKRRKQYTEDFQGLGCAVISVKDSDAALAALQESPAVDLVYTDLHLAGRADQKDGVLLANLLRELYGDALPIVGYSAHFSEVTETDTEPFTQFYIKGNLSDEEQVEMKTDCATMARSHRRSKRQNGLQYRTGSANVSAQELMLSVDTPDTLEHLLSTNGFEVRLLFAPAFESFATPVPAWVQTDAEGVAAQVYGQPLLHASGSDETEAINYLVELMQGMRDDIRTKIAAGEEFDKAHVQLLHYLETVLKDS